MFLNYEKFFYCEKCKYKTVRKSQFDRHLISTKHKNENFNVPKCSASFMCSCENTYKFDLLSNYKKYILWKIFRDFLCNHYKGYNGYIFIPARKYKIYLYNM